MNTAGSLFRRLLAGFALLLATAVSPQAATIVVTTTAQGVNADGQCSLQEAIYSANYDDNVAPDPTNQGQFVVTGCNKGSGDDIIELKAGATYDLAKIERDPANSLGPTGTPIVFSNIDIRAHGAHLEHTGNGHFRAFAVGPATVDLNAIDPGRTVSGTGSLTLENVYITGFGVKGGNGATGGGGGLGAGGAIYLRNGELLVVDSTFANNTALGGNGSNNGAPGRSGQNAGGGGGGLGGNGSVPFDGGGGGGGATGNAGVIARGTYHAGAGGGGTAFDGGIADTSAGGAGGYACGGHGGGDADEHGENATCAGGGGGGGGFVSEPPAESADAGNGSYGGGGGGGGYSGDPTFHQDGGSGGFGGGGGGGDIADAHNAGAGGNGGFGAGGGAGDTPGSSGVLAGNANSFNGGGGAGLGGAIFSDGGSLTVHNSTFFANSAYGGAGGDSSDSTAASAGEGQGNAIFSRNGTTTLTHITVSDSSDVNGRGIVDVAIAGDAGTAHLNLANSILANNKAGAPNAEVFTFRNGSVTQDNSGNLIETGAINGTVTGVVTSQNPGLKPLAYNPPGDTPTMAIPDTNSSAYGTGDTAKRLPADQRGVPRKTHPDIGAFELNDVPQSGPNFVVTTADDPGHGACGIVACSLRHAINAANTTTGSHAITFDATVTGTIHLDSTQGPVHVIKSMTITGPGARRLGISGNSDVGIFAFTGGTSILSGLTIIDGLVSAAPGSGSSAVGGGILNQGTLTVQLCTFSGNRAVGADNTTTAAAGGGTGAGGAIANYHILTVNRCTFVGNSVAGGKGAPGSTAIGGNVHGGPGGDALGAAVFADNSASTTLANCTFSSNFAAAGAGGHGQFGGNGGLAVGGIFNHGTMLATSCTLKANTGTGGAAGTGNNKFNGGAVGHGVGGLADRSSATGVRNTISAANTGSNGGGNDADGAFTSAGYNLIRIGDGSSGFTNTGDQVGTSAAPRDAKIGELANNGGPTDTIAPLAGSPVIDKGKRFGLSVDQRGESRPFDKPAIAPAPNGDNSDIGAFELH